MFDDRVQPPLLAMITCEKKNKLSSSAKSEMMYEMWDCEDQMLEYILG